MKWKFKKYKHGEVRTIEKFLFFPTCISKNEVSEWRWLEKVKIKQKFYNNINAFTTTVEDLKIEYLGGYWENLEFIEKSKDEIRNDKLKKIGVK